MKYDVFISYSSHDQRIVEQLCTYLEQNNISCFVAYRDIPTSTVWARAIVEAIEQSRMMLVVFSEHFNNSDQVDREIELASEERKPILTLRISNEAFKGAKKFYLKNINWIDAFPNPQDSFACIADSIHRLLGGRLDNIVIRPKRSSREIFGWIAKYIVLPIIVILGLVGFAHSVVEYFCDKEIKYEVGDYYDDGVKQGVVFEVWDDGKSGKIVSTVRKELTWDDAVEYCQELGTEWSLPTQSDLVRINKNMGEINEELLSNSGDMLDWTLYWSCATDESGDKAWVIYMGGGSSAYHDKIKKHNVRAVATF